MKTERYGLAKKLFLEVCDLPPKDREAIIAERCGDDAELRVDVESLLRHHDLPTSDPASESPTVTVSASPRVEEPQDLRAIGPYRVIREIGRGGMGVVYLAVREDDQFKRRVAIKLLKRGMDTEEVLKRFKLEEQLLAAMNHPGIARLYNAGETKEGLPYFVMEYVEGLTIEDYCDTNRLHLDERLELFRKVCAAVHYAHQNLVVHRDLKPSNIIVNSEGEPKLLDFGIAKVIHPEFSVFAGDPTAPELHIMTPEYASPEQVRGLPITTASDVYSLGVILYELVSGHRPYHLTSRVRDEMERVICEEEPERPSTALSRIDEPTPGTRTHGPITPESVAKSREIKPERLRRNLAGDIDNIVLMAMRKEPQRRYRSAEQLAEDIHRHLHGLPVIARPDTLSYRVVKFVGRNRGGVAAAAAISVLLVGGIVGTGTSMNIAWEEQERTELARQEEQKQREIAEQERAIAEAERERADRHVNEIMSLTDEMMHGFHDAIEQLDGALPAREKLVTNARKYLDGLADELDDDRSYQLQLAYSYDLVGDVYGGSRNPSKGDYAKALESFQVARSLRTKVAEVAPDDPEVKRGLASSSENFGDLHLDHGDVAAALAEFQTQLRHANSLADAKPGDRKARRYVAVALSNVGAALLANGDTRGAREHYRRSLDIREEIVEPLPLDDRQVDETVLRSQRDLSVIYLRVARRLQLAGETDAALEMYQRTIAIRKRLVDLRPDSLRYRRSLGLAEGFLGQAFADLNRPDDALGAANEFLAIASAAVDANPNDIRSQHDLSYAHQLLGRVHALRGEWDRAHQRYVEYQKVVERISASDPTRVEYRTSVADSYALIADIDAETGDMVKAEAGIRRGLAIMEPLGRKDPNDAALQQGLAAIQTQLGALLIDTDRNVDAVLELQKARTRYEALREKDPDNGFAAVGLARSLYELSRLRYKLGEKDAAIGLSEDALRLLDEGADDPELRGDVESALRRYREG